MDQHLYGGELLAVKLFDLQRFSVGGGLVGGMMGVAQRFSTDGLAPDNNSLAGYLGPVARLEFTPGSRVSLGLSGSWEILVMPDDQETLTTTTVPQGALDVTFWLR
jgi:hypothetical protein